MLLSEKNCIPTNTPNLFLYFHLKFWENNENNEKFPSLREEDFCSWGMKLNILGLFKLHLGFYLHVVILNFKFKFKFKIKEMLKIWNIETIFCQCRKWCDALRLLILYTSIIHLKHRLHDYLNWYYPVIYICIQDLYLYQSVWYKRLEIQFNSKENYSHLVLFC